MAKQTKQAVTVISTDWHLKPSNLEQVKDLVKQQCELAKKLGVEGIFCLGDVFNSRAGQTVEILNTFSEILDTIHKYDLKLVCIPGNHDKQSYDSDQSFLDPFYHHPALKLCYNFDRMVIEEHKMTFTMIPYYRENLWIEEYAAFQLQHPMKKGYKNILLSHIAMNGSTNNDGTKMITNIAPSDFKEWDLVLLGHYHDQQQPGYNVYHIPSIQQNNFGESPDKGFTVVFDDGTFDLVKSDFPEYRKIDIDLNHIDKKELEAITKECSSLKGVHIRFEFFGSEAHLKAINREEYIALGIDVKMKTKEVEDTIQYAETEIKEHNATSIIHEFGDFCEEKDKNYETGVKYLHKKLN